MRATSLTAAAALLALAPLSGCGSTPEDAQATPGPAQLTVWSTTSPDSDEGRQRLEMYRSFEEANPGISVEERQVAEAQDDYNDVVQTAITAGNMPDLLFIDGPNIASYAYQGGLTPLDDLLDQQVLDRTLPSLIAQGTWNDQLWSVGAFDSGLALWADRTALARAGVRIPTGPDDAWTAAEMTDVLDALAANDPDGKVLDMGKNTATSEWLTYGFAPLLYSAGAGLLDPDTGLATGTMDSPAAVSAMTTLQEWTAYIEPLEADDKAFAERRVALAMGGHWLYLGFHAALGDDLMLVPLPDLGNGTKSGQGSWAWAVGAGTAHPAEAAALVDWLTNDTNAATTATTNGAVPGTLASLAGSDLYGPGKPLELYGDQLKRTCGSGPATRECVTVPRPVTPAYPTITAAFATAVLAVIQGENPQQALSTAASTIDEVIERNDGYSDTPPKP